MNADDQVGSQLSSQIAIANPHAAKSLAHRMSPAGVGAVLQDLAANQNVSVRLLVLDIASEVPSEGASRAVLSRLLDGNLTVRAVANSLITGCAQKTVVPDLFEALQSDVSLPVKGVVARQIGTIGDKDDVERLRKLYMKTVESKLRGDLTAAMARLGDFRSRAAIVRQLADAEVDGRVAALQDVEYVHDAGLASHLGPLLEDRREAMVIFLPQQPRLSVRVCDVAAGSLQALGWPLSFRALPLRPHSDAEIREALSLVNSIAAGR